MNDLERDRNKGTKDTEAKGTEVLPSMDILCLVQVLKSGIVAPFNVSRGPLAFTCSLHHWNHSLLFITIICSNILQIASKLINSSLHF